MGFLHWQLNVIVRKCCACGEYEGVSVCLIVFMQMFRCVAERRPTALVSLNVRNLHLDWIKGDHGSWGVVCDVFKILKQQRQNLRSVILRGFMMLPHLLRFPIWTLAKDTAGKLQELDIVNAADCKTGNRAFGIHRAQLYTYLPSFHGLRKLTLNFVWVSAEILLRVCLECHLLGFLGLELFPANQRSTLTAVHWAQARHILPHLQVCVTVHGASEAESHSVLSRFQPHMPPFAVVVHTKLE